MAEKRTKSDAFMLRFPDGMRDRLKETAEANDRSLNNEIVQRLLASDDLNELIRDREELQRQIELLRRTTELQSELMSNQRELLDSQRTAIALLKRHAAYASAIAVRFLDALKAAGEGDPSMLDEEMQRQAKTPIDVERLRTLFHTVGFDDALQEHVGKEPPTK